MEASRDATQKAVEPMTTTLAKRDSDKPVNPHSPRAVVHAPYESEVISVTWEWWRITQSQYHRRPIGVVDLGEIE